MLIKSNFLLLPVSKFKIKNVIPFYFQVKSDYMSIFPDNATISDTWETQEINAIDVE